MEFYSCSPDELMHYGVKGMKWGVRKDRDSSTNRGKNSKRKLKDLSILTSRNKMNGSEYSELLMSDGGLPKGTKMYRVTRSAKEHAGRKYMSFVPEDTSIYASRDTMSDAKYQKEYTLKKDIKVAGASTVFNTILECNPKLANSKLSDVVGEKNAKGMYDGNASNTVSEVARSLSDHPKEMTKFLADYSYYDNSSFNTQKDTETNRIFYNKLREKGYDASLDVSTVSQGDDIYPVVMVNDSAYENTKTKVRGSHDIFHSIMEFYSCSPDELMHYGVKGMKWGVIRSKVSKSRNAKVRKLKKDLKTAQKEAAEAKAKLSENEKRDTNKSKKPDIKTMSNDDLKKLVERTELEQKYKKLMSPDEKQKLFDGKQFVMKVINDKGGQLANEIFYQYAGSAVNKMTGLPIANVKTAEKKKDD